MSVTQTRSRRHWLWLIPVGLLVMVLLVGFAWWQYFKTTPSYSLALLVDAAQQNDRAAFDRVVDLDQVIDNFISQEAQNSSVGLTPVMVTSVRMQLQSLAPETTARVKERVKEEIRSRTNELSGSSGSRPFLVTALAIPFLAEIAQSGNSVQAKMDRHGRVELLMERSGGNDWKVTSLQDQALGARVVNAIVKELPRTGSPLNEQMRKQLLELPESLHKLPLLNGR